MTERAAALLPLAPARRRVLCFGNPLHGDDGVGRAVFERLSARALPADVSVCDAGAADPAAVGLFEEADEIVVVDASAPDGRPGRVWWPNRAELDAAPTGGGHGGGVGHLLRCVETLVAPMPRIEVVAIEAETVAPFRPGLSAPVAGAVDGLVDLLARRLSGGADG